MDDNKKERIKLLIKVILNEHIGENNKIFRDDLRDKIKIEHTFRYGNKLILGDRKMRDLIEELRDQDVFGSRICSETENGGGYWIAPTMADLEDKLSTDERRCRTTMDRIKHQRINAIRAFGSDDFTQLAQGKLL
jgi:hypothetical protein